MADKREVLDGMMTPEQKKDIRELQEAVLDFVRNGDQKSYEKVQLAFFAAARDGKATYCPAESFNSGEKTFEPGKVATTDGKMYVVCSSPEEAALCPDESIVVIGTDHIVAAAAGDPDANGICLNPYGMRPCFFPRAYIKRIPGM